MAGPRRSGLAREDARRHRGDDGHDRAEHLEREIEHLREIVDEGESEWTPAIIGGGMLLILIPIVALMIGVGLAVYFWV